MARYLNFNQPFECDNKKNYYYYYYYYSYYYRNDIYYFEIDTKVYSIFFTISFIHKNSQHYYSVIEVFSPTFDDFKPPFKYQISAKVFNSLGDNIFKKSNFIASLVRHQSISLTFYDLTPSCRYQTDAEVSCSFGNNIFYLYKFMA